MLEIYQYDNASEHRFSYALAIIVFIWTFIIILLPIHYFKYSEKGKIETRYFWEIYDGFKDNKAGKLYMFTFLLKRFLMACVIVFLRHANVYLRCILFGTIQFWVFLYLIIFRPFGDRKNNIVESINEATCFILCVAITIHNDESKWFDGLDGDLIYFLVVAGMIIGAVINIEMVIGWIQSCKEKRAERRAKKRAEQYAENAGEQVEEERKSTEGQAMHQLSNQDQSQSKSQSRSWSQNIHKKIEQNDHPIIQNENLSEDWNFDNDSR